MTSPKRAVAIMLHKEISLELPRRYAQKAEEAFACRESGNPYFLIPFDARDWQPQPETAEDLQVMREERRKVWKFLWHKYVFEPVETLEGYSILLRTSLGHKDIAAQAVSNLGGIHEITPEDDKIVNRWPDYVNPDFLKRKLGIVKASDLKSKLNEYAIEGRVFIKPLSKDKPGRDGSGMVESIDKILEARQKKAIPYDFGRDSCDIIRVADDEEIILSQPLGGEFDRPAMWDCLNEYRAWVIDHNIACIVHGDGFFYGYPRFNHKVPEIVSALAGEFVKNHSDKLPKHYVVDITVNNSKDVAAVVELNPLGTSGNTNQNVFKEVLTAYFSNSD